MNKTIQHYLQAMQEDLIDISEDITFQLHILIL